MNCGRLRSKNGVCLFRPTPFATHSLTHPWSLALKIWALNAISSLCSSSYYKFPNVHIFGLEGVFLHVTEKSLGTKKTNQYSCLKQNNWRCQFNRLRPLHSQFQEKITFGAHSLCSFEIFIFEWVMVAREVPLKKEWSHSKLPTKISKKPPARASLEVALISLLSTQYITKCQLTVTFGTS